MKEKKQTTTETAIILPDEASVAISIKDETDMSRATSILSVLNRTLDILTEQKKKITEPANQILKETRARYKPYETKLENKISEIRQMMTDYKTKQFALHAKKEADLAAKIASGDISIEKAADKLNKLPEISKNTEVAEGSVSFKPIKKFTVVSLQDVPLEYHLANESMIRTAMNAGTELPGVKYFVEQVPYNSR